MRLDSVKARAHLRTLDSTMTPYLVVIISLAVLTLGAELLVRGASALALRLGVSPLFVGLTVVGFGTSSPELGASLSATLRGATGISIGNVIGSNILNVAVILGVTALLRPIPIVFSAVQRDLRIAIAAGCIPLAGYALGGAVSRPLGLLSLLGLAVYLVSAYRKDRQAQEAEQLLALEEVQHAMPMGPLRWDTVRQVVIHGASAAGGLGLLVVGADQFVRAATEIARGAGVSELVIGLTIVAGGTSLPELVTSVVAALRKSSDVAVGNIIGSNIFNMLGILGTCALVAPQPIAGLTALVDVPVMLAFSIVLFPMVKSGGVVSRREGAALLAGYGVYLAYLLISAQA